VLVLNLTSKASDKVIKILLLCENCQPTKQSESSV